MVKFSGKMSSVHIGGVPLDDVLSGLYQRPHLRGWGRSRRTIEPDGFGVTTAKDQAIMCYIVANGWKYERPWKEGDSFDTLREEFMKAVHA